MTVFRASGLVFVGVRDCQVEEFAVDTSSLKPSEVLVEVEVSVVSAGTEVANFTGLDPGTRVPGSWNAYPHRPGYGAVGRVVALGPALSKGDAGLVVGNRVFAICRHARYGTTDLSERPVVRVLEEDDAKTIVLARMASVAVTAVRKASRLELGGTAVVIGLGLVGNFAAQLFQLAGLDVLCLDKAADRVEMARATGLTAVTVANGSESEAVWESFDRGADIVVEASGSPDASTTAVTLVRDGGEIILLGSPRGPFGGDATSLLAAVFHRGAHVTGALEWLMPLRSGLLQSRWSLHDNYLLLFRLLREGRLRTTGLVTDVVRPEDSQQTYSRLALREPGMGGVLFDWGQKGMP